VRINVCVLARIKFMLAYYGQSRVMVHICTATSDSSSSIHSFIYACLYYAQHIKNYICIYIYINGPTTAYHWQPTEKQSIKQKKLYCSIQQSMVFFFPIIIIININSSAMLDMISST